MATLHGETSPVRGCVHRLSRLALGLAASTLLPVACEPPIQQITITAQDFRFEPDTIHVSGDSPIRLIVFNQGREPHTFESPLLTDRSVQLEAATLAGVSGRPARWQIPPGKSLDLRLRAPRGPYLFACGMRGHTGMSGTFIVE